MSLLFPVCHVSAMPIGTLLYRSSGGNMMYGYNSDDLITTEKGKLAHIYSGHAAMYVGKENGVDYIVEMQPKGAIKVPAKNFINEASGEKLVGAKIPINASPLQIAKAVAIAKNLAENNLAYDFDFKYQKGPNNGQWTCVGLTEKVYESANISNPTNLSSLEYNPSYYAVDITSDGYDDSNVYNATGDCFATNLEYSKIERKTNMLIPAPELVGFDVGLEHDGNRYMFLPYTQYLQSNLKDVPVDIELSSSFSEPEIRGNSPVLGLILKWSLINNPISTVKSLASKVGNTIIAIKDSVFPDSSLALAENSSGNLLNSSAATSSKATTTKTTKTTSSKATSTKTVVSKSAVSKATTTPKIAASSTAAKSSTVNAKSSKTATSTPVTKTKTTATTKTTSTPIYYSSSTPVVYKPSTSTVPAVKNTSTATSTVYIPPVIPKTYTEPEVTTEPEIPIALIAKIYSNGGDDWLEIVNTTDKDFDLAAAGYRLEKAKMAADPTLILRFGNEADGVFPGGTVIKAKGIYLVASDSASAEITAKADAIVTKDAFSWTEDSYTIYLGTASISSDDDPDIVDKLGYGEAQYYEGTAPADALKKGYALERKASATSTLESMSAGGLQEFWSRLYDSNDNSADFILTPYDLEVIESENEENNSSTSSNPIGDGLFQNPTGLNSEDLTELWHFDECYGEKGANELQVSGGVPADFKLVDSWLPGIWGCAINLNSSNPASAKAVFYEPLNPNQTTLNFYYQSTQANFELTLKLSNSLNTAKQASIKFTPYYTEIYGFPGPEGRISEIVWPADNAWHQISVVVNRSGGYWAAYLDGRESYRYEYTGIMSTFEYLELDNNQVEQVAIDELSMWGRSLPATELRTINLLKQPFNPYTWPEKQVIAKLEHYWSFDENTGEISQDLTGSNNMSVASSQWDMEGRNSSAITLGQTINLPLSNLSVSDLSLSLWWRNTSSPNEGRLHVSLQNGVKNILSLKPTSYNAVYSFNNYSENIFRVGENLIPNDNKWHHLALTYDSYRFLLSFYLDGKKIAAKQYVKLKADEKINNLEIARENWPSSIDELKMWTGLLTETQIKAEYDALK